MWSMLNYRIKTLTILDDDDDDVEEQKGNNNGPNFNTAIHIYHVDGYAFHIHCEDHLWKMLNNLKIRQNYYGVFLYFSLIL